MSHRQLSLLSLVVFAALLMPFTSAQQEFSSTSIGFARGTLLQQTWNPTDAKVACKPDNSVCVAILYEKAGLVGYSEGLKLFQSTNPPSGVHFLTSYSCGGFGLDALLHGCSPVTSVPATFDTVDYDGVYESNDYGDEFPYPYDIYYRAADDKFYIIFSVMGDTSTPMTTYQYSYNGDLSAPTLVSSASSQGFMFLANSTHYVVVEGLNQYFDGANYRYELDWKYCPFGSATCSAYYRRVEIFNGGGSSYACKHLASTAAYGYNGSVGEQYYVKGRYAKHTMTCASAIIDSFTSKTTWNFAGAYSGFQYFDGSSMYYSYGSNSSLKVTTTGASFSSPTLLKSWTGGETFWHGDSAESDSNKVYLIDRGNATPSGIFVYNEHMYPFKVQAKGLNPATGSISDVSVSTTLVCSSANYTDSASGISQVVTSVCHDDNGIILSASGWKPVSATLTGIDALSESGYTYIRSPANGLGWVSDYNFTLRFVDSFTGSPVVGATVTVGTDVRTTDSNGDVKFYLKPYDSGVFTVSPVGTSYYLYFNGTPATYDYVFNAAGYSQKYGTFALTTDYTPDDMSDFDLMDTVQVDPTLVSVIVDVNTLDGIHYDGDSVVVRIGGSQSGVYYDDGGILTERNYATSFPSTFKLLDNRSSWTLDLNLTQDGYFFSDTETVYNTTGVVRYDFTLPNASTNQDCTTDAGCSETFCRGTTWYSDGACVTGKCSYDSQSCLLCDDSAGCYDEETLTNCPTGLDFECIGENMCMDTKILKSYKCSSGNACVWELVTCDYMCADAVCVPAVPVVECDDSTPIGMLGCMQSGVMGFIGSTYNPLITIGVALFLVVLVGGLLAAAFKATGNVIR